MKCHVSKFVTQKEFFFLLMKYSKCLTGHTDFSIDCSWRRRTWPKCPTNYVFYHQIHQKRVHNIGCDVQTSTGKCIFFYKVRTLIIVHNFAASEHLYRVFRRQGKVTKVFYFKMSKDFWFIDPCQGILMNWHENSIFLKMFAFALLAIFSSLTFDHFSLSISKKKF